MSMGATYGSGALRRMREQQETRTAASECQPSFLDQLPPDAPMDDAILTVWNGERFVAYDSWLATAPIEISQIPAPSPRRRDGVQESGQAQLEQREQLQLPMESANHG